MTEQGPFRPRENGQLRHNEYSWNKLANMVFIEQPVGVGFSVASSGAIQYGDAQVIPVAFSLCTTAPANHTMPDV
jgi:carboxypeptidase C (cathepsin A)